MASVSTEAIVISARIFIKGCISNDKNRKKILDFIESHLMLFFFLAVLLIGCCMRIAGFHFLSHDAKAYLLKWYDKIAETGLAEQVGNYNIPYQVIIFILTKLPLKPLHAYKLVSCAFDLALALAAGYITWDFSKKSRELKSILAFTLIFCSPIVIMNSAVWAQCDSIYTFFAVAALYFLYKEKYQVSFVFLGLAFAFKLQTFFVVPFFLIYYVCRKKYSILNFFIIPAVMIIMSLPGLLAGRSAMDIIRIYVGQTGTFNRVYANFPNLYAIVTDSKGYDYILFQRMAILLTVLVLGCGMLFCMIKKVQLDKKILFFGIAIWSMYTCNFLLPNMHERYAYGAEVLSIIYCFMTPEAIPLAVVLNLTASIVYASYLFKYYAFSIPFASLVSLITYVAFSCWLFLWKRKRIKE